MWLSSARLMSLFAISTALFTLGCQGETPTPVNDGSSSVSGSDKLQIVATCGMVTDIVRAVAGDRANVDGLMNERVDPHLYKPTRDDLNRLMEADIVFYVGLQLEGRMSETFDRVKADGISVNAVTDGIDKAQLRQPEEFEGHYDPHVWMDIELWSQCVVTIEAVLVKFDPEHADEYRSRSAAYREKLTKLQVYAREVMATIPENQRVLITAHDAFGYFARAYGIEVKSLQGITTESEASVDDVNQLVDLIVERKVPALFVESSVNQEGLKAILEGAQKRGSQIRLGGELFSDAMGAPGTYTGTYIGMMDHNITTMVRSLGGVAPPQGFQGELDSAIE